MKMFNANHVIGFLAGVACGFWTGEFIKEHNWFYAFLAVLWGVIGVKYIRRGERRHQLNN